MVAAQKDLFDYAHDNRASIVYLVTNRINGKRYVGITRNKLRIRKAGHKNAMNRGEKTKFLNALRKYGFDNFDFCEIYQCDTFCEAKVKEQEYIALHKPEYNTTLGGDGVLGYRPTLEARLARSRNMQGMQPFLGKRHTEETKALISEKKKQRPTRYWAGKRRSAECKAKISASLRGRALSAAAIKGNQNRGTPVLCVQDGLAFPTARAAARHYHITVQSVIYYCNKNGIRESSARRGTGKSFVYAEVMI